MLATHLEGYCGQSDVVVLALPRGGVPVAYEVAAALGVPMDIFLVRKLGVPGHQELAMGAITEGDVVVLNEEIANQVTWDDIRPVVTREAAELRRQALAYRDGRAPVDVTGRTVIVVDDGMATGASMRAAVQALEQPKKAVVANGEPAGPKRIVVAVPVGPESSKRWFDEVVFVETPASFVSVGQAYWRFPQVSDQEVQALLAR